MENLDTKILELKAKMLVIKALYETTKAEREKAHELEDRAEKLALIQYNKLYNTNHTQSYMIFDTENAEQKFFEYEKLLQKEFEKMGIKNELNNVYSCDFDRAYWRAEKKYLLCACDFLELFNRTKESNQIKNAINTYIREDYKAKLIELNNKFLGIGE